MHVLRIEHHVASYEGWKQAFDADPIDRAGSGVRRYRILRDSDDPLLVGIDLEFDTREQADAAHAALRELWPRVEGAGLIAGIRSRIDEVVESVELTPRP
ncbi:hypothetical protein [Nitriliruptor alkaliphilus]|uniref:hypothetical protein n=1 Tax=Nitriliruptor alkaliphilus TaxID=427918 RepID=UPI000698DCAF|nr:hypothetical protein [Nitriliruptor alkaliphilus]